MQMEKKTPSMMGQVNRTNVLHLIKEQGPMSRAAVAKTLNMSRSTISTIVETLIREGRIREGRTGESTSAGGRKPVNLHYVSNARYAFGMDIGASKTIAMITDLEGRIIVREKFPTHQDGKPTMVHILQQAESFLAKAGISPRQMIGTAIGFPGITMAEHGIVVDAPGLHLHDFPASDFFRKMPGPIWIDNDVNMAVIGERWLGAAVGRDNVVLVAVGTGIGAGFILNGHVYRGKQGFAGEMGHLHVTPYPTGQKLLLSDYGPLEQIASGKGMEDVAKAKVASYPDSVFQRDEIRADKLFEAEAAGDALAKDVIDNAVSHLTMAIANLVTLLNPEVVILAGGVSRVGKPLLSRIQQRVEQLSPMACDIVAAHLGEDAAAFGAAATVLMHTGELRLSGFDDWQVIAQTSEQS